MWKLLLSLSSFWLFFTAFYYLSPSSVVVVVDASVASPLQASITTTEQPVLHPFNSVPTFIKVSSFTNNNKNNDHRGHYFIDDEDHVSSITANISFQGYSYHVDEDDKKDDENNYQDHDMHETDNPTAAATMNLDEMEVTMKSNQWYHPIHLPGSASQNTDKANKVPEPDCINDQEFLEETMEGYNDDPISKCMKKPHLCSSRSRIPSHPYKLRSTCKRW